MGPELRPISAGTVWTLLRKCAERANIIIDGEQVHFTTHDFRRIFATDALASGLPPTSCRSCSATRASHPHACLRCALLRPDPAQADRLREIIANLHARITEAEQNNWLGEVEGLKVSLAGAQEKLEQMERQTAADGPELLCLPTINHD